MVSIVSEFVAMSTPFHLLSLMKRRRNVCRILSVHLASLISASQSKPSLFPHVVSLLPFCVGSDVVIFLG